jgi:hypothetical protein
MARVVDGRELAETPLGLDLDDVTDADDVDRRTEESQRRRVAASLTSYLLHGRDEESTKEAGARYHLFSGPMAGSSWRHLPSVVTWLLV